jgi:hypothetical protein
MDVALVFHVLLFFLIVSTAFYPIKVLRSGVFAVPFVVSLTWVFCGGCVFNRRRTDGTRENDMHRVLTAVGLDVSEATAKYMVYSGIVLLPTIMVGRVLSLPTTHINA